MRSAIDIFCSRVDFRQRFLVNNNEMADEYDTDAGGNRGSLLTVILGECFVNFEAAGISEATSSLECFRQRSLSSRQRIRLVTSNFGTRVRVLFAFCSMTPIHTAAMAIPCLHLRSIIGSVKLISTLSLSIQRVTMVMIMGQVSGCVQPWMEVSATVEHRFPDMVALIPTSQFPWD